MAPGAPLPSSFDENADFYNESRANKFFRRLREEPLVPLGCLLTVFAFVGATRALRKNDHVTANIMFRRRIYAQGLTIAALVAGSTYWSGDRNKRKEFEEAEKERTKAERRERWLAELEARDREDKEMKERVGRRLGRRRGDVFEGGVENGGVSVSRAAGEAFASENARRDGARVVVPSDARGRDDDGGKDGVIGSLLSSK